VNFEEDHIKSDYCKESMAHHIIAYMNQSVKVERGEEERCRDACLSPPPVRVMAYLSTCDVSMWAVTWRRGRHGQHRGRRLSGGLADGGRGREEGSAPRRGQRSGGRRRSRCGQRPGGQRRNQREQHPGRQTGGGLADGSRVDSAIMALGSLEREGQKKV
jgi:hypothetical protein